MTDTPAPPPVEVDPATVRAWLDAEDDVVLLDCRTDPERHLAAIEPSQFIPMQVLADRVAELESNRERTIVVYCHHGVRSLRVTHWLRAQGFDRATSMAGGIDRWSQEVDPTVPTYG